MFFYSDNAAHLYRSYQVSLYVLARNFGGAGGRGGSAEASLVCGVFPVGAGGELGGQVGRDRLARCWVFQSLRRVLALIFRRADWYSFVPWRLAAERGADFDI